MAYKYTNYILNFSRVDLFTKYDFGEFNKLYKKNHFMVLA